MMNDVEVITLKTVSPKSCQENQPSLKRDTMHEQIKELIFDAPSVNYALVEHFKKAIATGNYSICSSTIALKILTSLHP